MRSAYSSTQCEHAAGPSEYDYDDYGSGDDMSGDDQVRVLPYTLLTLHIPRTLLVPAIATIPTVIFGLALFRPRWLGAP